MNRRDLNMAIVQQLKEINKHMGAFVAGVLSDDISKENQIAFALRLVRLAEFIKDRADGTVGMVIEGGVEDDDDCGRPAFPAARVFDQLAAIASYGRSARAIIMRVIDDLAPEAPEDGE
ncbi:MAG TPA: hypothetical protein VIY28_04130 [Pseudonocardiaceae bacterium]